MAGTVKVMFQLIGVDLDPDEVTRATGIAPATTWQAGQTIGTSIRRYKKNGWRIEAEDGAAEIEQQVDSVLARLAAARAALEPFLRRCESELSLVVRGDHGMPAVYFTPAQLRQIAALGCGIDVDILYA